MESTALNEEELLSDKLEKGVEGYCGTDGSDEKRQNLLQVLQNNDCREIVSKSVNGDKLLNAFAWSGALNHLDVLEAFLDHGMNVNIKDENGDTALMFATVQCHEESVQFLLNHQANVDLQDNHGWSALMCASNRADKEIVQILLDHNANIDLKNKSGLTALDVAKTQEIKEMIRNHVNTSYVLK